jgi:hypothetical protein
MSGQNSSDVATANKSKVGTFGALSPYIDIVSGRTFVLAERLDLKWYASPLVRHRKPSARLSVGMTLCNGAFVIRASCLDQG